MSLSPKVPRFGGGKSIGKSHLRISSKGGIKKKRTGKKKKSKKTKKHSRRRGTRLTFYLKT